MKRNGIMVSITAVVLLLFLGVGAIAGDSEYLVSDEPLELSIHMHIWDNTVFKDDWKVFEKASELTNVRLEGTASPAATDSVQVFTLTVSAGDLADIVVLNQGQLHDDFVKYAMDGAFIPLNDLIDEHAPNIKAFLEKRPDVKRNATAPDGNMYYIPFTPDGEAAMGWFIRTDWLEELDLEIPETVDEYYQVLKAFKEQDPNGNGENDEIPFFRRDPSGIKDLIILWNAREGFYADADGNVQWGPYEPEYKTAIQNIAKWYDEGLIDSEIFTRGWSARDVLLGDDLAGSTHDWFGSTSGYNDKLQEKVPGFEFIPFAPPAGPDGVHREASKRAQTKDAGWGISYLNENPVETIKYFDFWFTEEGRRLMNFGIEGVTYDMVDGKPKFKEELVEAGKVRDTLKEMGAQTEIGYHQNFDYERQWMNPIALSGVEEYMTENYFIDQFPTLPFTVEEQEKVNSIWTDINTYYSEQEQKWILGAESVEENYDKYIKRLEQLGIEELLSLYQKAYDRHMNQ